MSLPTFPCRLCNEWPTAFDKKERVFCDNVECPLFKLVLTTEQWDRLMKPVGAVALDARYAAELAAEHRRADKAEALLARVIRNFVEKWQPLE